MNRYTTEVEADLAWVIETVVRAGQGAQMIRASGLTRSEKTHQDFVTSADREVEASIRELIRQRFPGDTVLGEESGNEVSATAVLLRFLKMCHRSTR